MAPLKAIAARREATVSRSAYRTYVNVRNWRICDMPQVGQFVVRPRDRTCVG